MPIQFAVKFGDSPKGNSHYHKSMHEYFLVLKGSIELSVNGEKLTVGEGDLLIVDPGEPHQMLAKSPNAQYVLLMPGPVPNDKVEL